MAVGEVIPTESSMLCSVIAIEMTSVRLTVIALLTVLLSTLSTIPSGISQKTYSLTVETKPPLMNLLLAIDGQVFQTASTGKISRIVSAGGHTAKILDTIIPVGLDSRYVFRGWQGTPATKSPEIRFEVNSNTTLVAEFVREHFLHVVSPFNSNTATGQGWHPEGELVRVSINSTFEDKPLISRWNCKGFQLLSESKQVGEGTNSSLIVPISKPVTIVFLWERQYYVDLENSEPLVDPKVLSGARWYSVGAKVNLGVNSPYQTRPDHRYVFDRWQSRGENVAWFDDATSTRTSFLAFGYYKIRAVWKLQFNISFVARGLPEDVKVPVQIWELAPDGSIKESTMRRIEASDSGWFDSNVRLRFNYPQVISTGPFYSYFIKGDATGELTVGLRTSPVGRDYGEQFNIDLFQKVLAVLVVIIPLAAWIIRRLSRSHSLFRYVAR